VDLPGARVAGTDDVGQARLRVYALCKGRARTSPGVLATAGTGDRDRALPAALLYYKLSTSEHAFLGDSVTWALGDGGEEIADSSYERTRIEQAFHNAFKSIEALIGGEPPSDERKFRRRLEAIGVDHQSWSAFVAESVSRYSRC
jgi:hypothetical protein